MKDSPSTGDRQGIINSFNSDLSLVDPNGNVKEESPDVIISTINLLGAGYTCMQAV